MTTEVLKLQSVRSTWLLVVAAQIIVVAGISGLVLSGEDISESKTVSTAFAHVGLAAICSLLLGILATAGEYRHRTITDTYLSTPDRGRVVAGKLGVCILAGAGNGVVGAAIAVATAAIWWTVKGASFHLDAGGWQTLAGAVGWNALFAAIGVAVGALVRNVAAAIAVTLGWIAVVETIAAQLLGSGLSRWLPFAAAQALGRANLNSGHLPQWGGAVVLGGYALLIAGAAMSVTVRRDVT
jgi:ABC-2 type transport system permease protein